MNLDEIIQNIQRVRSAPSDDDLRSLPHKKAYIYGRLSSQIQVRQSHESIRDVAKLVELAKRDGYQTDLDPREVEKWLESIQTGVDSGRVIEDGEVTTNCEDLGLSGALGQDKRPGLADLWRGVESGEIGAVYLTEGMSRLSRDRDRVLGYKLLKLLKEKQCRVRTPEGVYNPAIPRDWENLAEDVEDSADEMRKSGIRLGRRRASKAAEGRHVGNPVCPGYVVAIEGHKNDGSYILGKWQPYPPHQEVVITALEELVKQGSVFKTSQALNARGVVFPFFTEEFKYMETRSVLRRYHRNDRGYRISPHDLKGLATNLKLTGIWQWHGTLIKDNHPAIVPVELFEQAYEAAKSKKPRGRAIYAEPLEWSGLLYCCNHEEPRSLSAHNVRRRWVCSRGYQSGLESECLQIADHKLTPPLTKEILHCLELSPHAETVLEKLKTDVSDYDLEGTRRRRQKTELRTRIANLEHYLGSTDDPEREETYWRLIGEAKTELESAEKKPPPPKVTVMDIEDVKSFLANLEGEWEKYPGRLRNRLLKLLIERVELRHDLSRIEATIVWNIGLRQVVSIRRLSANYVKDSVWQKGEDDLLRMLWPSSPQETILAALPKRSWSAINQRASRQKIERVCVKTNTNTGRRWTGEDKKQLEELYTKEASVEAIAKKLNRSHGTVAAMASKMGISRPRELRYRKDSPAWDTVNIKVIQDSTSACS